MCYCRGTENKDVPQKREEQLRQSCFCLVQYCLASAWASTRTACWQLTTLLHGRTGLEGFWHPHFWEARSYPATGSFAGYHLFYPPNILEPSVWLSSSAFLPCWTLTAWAEWSQSLHSQRSSPAYPHSSFPSRIHSPKLPFFPQKVFPWVTQATKSPIDGFKNVSL